MEATDSVIARGVRAARAPGRTGQRQWQRQLNRSDVTPQPRTASVSCRPAAIAVLLAGSSAAAGTDTVVAPLDGCNSQLLGSGAEILWTSSFASDAYGFDVRSRSRRIFSGSGDILEVTVQWSTSDPESPSRAVAFGPRGSGFTPPGVDGLVEFNDVTPQAVPDPGLCAVDPEAPSYGRFTFTLQFTDLHRAPRRVGEGTALFAIDVGTADEVVSLGVNVDVTTSPAPEADGDGGLYITEDEAIAIARRWGLDQLTSSELSGGVWEIKGFNSAGVAIELAIDATDGSVLSVDYGHPSPRSR